jgi:hypothetical protein
VLGVAPADAVAGVVAVAGAVAAVLELVLDAGALVEDDVVLDAAFAGVVALLVVAAVVVVAVAGFAAAGVAGVAAAVVVPVV